MLKKLDYPSQRVARIDGRREHVVVQCRRRARLSRYTLALAIGDTVIPLDADVRQWLPGDSVYENTIAVPSDLAPGRYPVRVALLDPVSRKPAIRLAIEGRQPDGWYQVGEITVN